MNFYSTLNCQKTIGFFIASGKTEVHWFAWIHLILEAQFSNDTLNNKNDISLDDENKKMFKIFTHPPLVLFNLSFSFF